MPVIDADRIPVTQSKWRTSRVIISPERFDSHHMFVSLNELFKGAAHEEHTHSVDELLIVLDGQGVYEGEGGSHRIGPMSAVYVPKDTPHKVKGVGNIPLKLIVIKAPPE